MCGRNNNEIKFGKLIKNHNILNLLFLNLHYNLKYFINYNLNYYLIKIILIIKKIL